MKIAYYTSFQDKKKQQKVTNSMFFLTLTVGIGSIQSCEAQYNLFCRWFPNSDGLGKLRYANAMQCCDM